MKVDRMEQVKEATMHPLPSKQSSALLREILWWALFTHPVHSLHKFLYVGQTVCD